MTSANFYPGKFLRIKDIPGLHNRGKECMVVNYAEDDCGISNVSVIFSMEKNKYGDGQVWDYDEYSFEEIEN